MILTHRNKDSTPPELQILSYLHPRMSLCATQKTNFKNLQKGSEGERKTIQILKKQLSSNYLAMNDLLLQVNDTEFQIDILLIGKSTIYPLEVKNYEGDFYIRNGNWFSASSGNEIKNPLHQIKRSELLLQNFLKSVGFNFSIEPYIIFINPESSLYEATLNLPIIFPTQINRFIRKLNSNPFNQMKQHHDLAKTFIDNSLAKSFHSRLPQYDYAKLKKGIVCKFCSTFLTFSNSVKLICRGCGSIEDLESAVKRSIIEFTTLFPNNKITTSAIHEWCHIIKSKKTIRRILLNCMNPVGIKNHRYYTFKS